MISFDPKAMTKCTLPFALWEQMPLFYPGRLLVYLDVTNVVLTTVSSQPINTLDSSEIPFFNRRPIAVIGFGIDHAAVSASASAWQKLAMYFCLYTPPPLALAMEGLLRILQLPDRSSAPNCPLPYPVMVAVTRARCNLRLANFILLL